MTKGEVTNLLGQVEDAQVRLYMKMAKWSREEALRAGTECYFKGNIEPVAKFAGVDIDFDFAPGEMTDQLLPEMTDAKAAALLGALTAAPWHTF
jgi:hypothetical protein